MGVLLPLAAVAACQGGTAGAGAAGPGAPAGAAGPAAPSENVVADVRKDPEAAKLLPESVRKKGSLRLASSIGTPPGAFHPSTGTNRPAGVDIDVADAVAKVLGVRLERQEAGFEAILPALESGKFDLGTGNFGVTEERLRTIDFVTYVNDGQGFAVRGDDKQPKKVTDLVQLCGRNIGVGAGTTFETTLRDAGPRCAKTGREPYDVKVYSDNGALLTSLQQGRIDVVMSTINGLRYQASQEAAGVRFLNEFQRLDVGFALKKGSPLREPLRAAVNRLIEDGTYDRILKKWGTQKSALTESRISPPERKPAR
ncbi:ABC transporter substrate-binding protein [Streptomyces sp. HNM0574]|uniref:ABC transporter substrate-binding protein n=1 Tax=Streptomyces sp. HNM0574 TaxID=2714954 RepID=UPI00146A0257|nr:ABC transporter substrate-binding protein [Streptomyces sp. HNM0574]NLU66168.1 ABC transporter substrate-binding protein [Streptomyces sp. HNM0574]